LAFDAGFFTAEESAGFTGGVAGAFADCAKLKKDTAQRNVMSVKAFFIRFKLGFPKLVIFLLSHTILKKDTLYVDSDNYHKLRPMGSLSLQHTNKQNRSWKQQNKCTQCLGSGIWRLTLPQ
jgi:hypothetical protein